MSKVPPSCFCQRVSPFRFVATHSPVGLDSVPPNRLSMQDCCTEPSIPPSSVCSHTPSWFKDRFHENSPGVGLFCGEQRSHASSSWPDRSDAEFLTSSPVLKGGDSYTVRLNEGLRFGGFPFHRHLRCDRLAPVPVLRRLHGRLTTRRVPPRRECSRPRSSHGRAGRRT